MDLAVSVAERNAISVGFINLSLRGKRELKESYQDRY
jgi:hypothetical protein